MYNTVEYTYEDEKRHLTGDDALEVYKSAKSRYPQALVILDDLDCGHWGVHVYETEKQKQQYYNKRLNSVYRNMLSRLKAWAK